MRYSGSVYRPPSEAKSLIVQCTLGCSHNKCAFCNMYKDKVFSIRPLEEVLEDLADARRAFRRIDRMFLADGDALILPMDYLTQVLRFIRAQFPECARIAAYASAKSLMSKTDADLAALRAEGVSIVYIGLESGNERLLEKYNKGVTAQEIVTQSLRAKAAGMEISVTVINGMGGTALWQEHAVDTAAALSAIKPAYMALLTLRVYHDTPLYEWIERGEMVIPEPPELARETRLLLEHIDSEGSVFRSNHASNYLPLAGTLNRDRQAMIDQIDRTLAGATGFRRFVELGF